MYMVSLISKTTDLIHPDHPVISITVGGDASSSEEEDSLSLQVTVQSQLPCVWTFPSLYVNYG